MLEETQSNNQNEDHFYKIYSKVAGYNHIALNDIIIFKSKTINPAQYNFIFFGGDIQDYEEEMLKSSTCKWYKEWNLINTGKLLLKKISKQVSTNVIIVRPDYYHLRTFSNYSNFVASNNLGAPLDIDEQKEKDDLDKDKTRCWTHLLNLINNGIQLFNSDFPELKVDKSLPIVLCGFSKGCIVLNELCKELKFIGSRFDEFKSRIEYLIWLDGGHSGSSKAWITDEEDLKLVKSLSWKCRVFITCYQLNKLEHVRDYYKFIEVSEKLGVDLMSEFCQKGCKNEDFDSQLRMHFELLNNFEICLKS